MFQRLLHPVDETFQSVPGKAGRSASAAAGLGTSPKRPSRLWRRILAAGGGLLGAARRRPKTTAVVLTVLAVGLAVAALYGYAFHEWAEAQAAVKEERTQDAQAHLRPCLFLWPDSVAVHLLAARAARINGDFTAAESHLARCLKLGDRKADVQLEFLLMRVQTGEEDVVAPDLMAYVDNKHPDSSLILETLARAFMDKVRYGPAYAVLDRWVREAPDSTRALEWRGWVQERMDQTDKAAEDYRRACELNPRLTAVHLRLADLALSKADPTSALPHLEHLPPQDAERPDVKALLGRCRFQQGRAEEARRLMEAAVKDLPDDPALLVTLAKLDLQEKRPADAEQRLHHALEVDPTDTEARYTLIGVLRFEGREDEAAAMLKEYEKDAAVLREAARRLQDEAERPSQNPDDLYQIGILFVRGNQGRVGEYWLQRALEMDPRHQPTLKALAEYYDSKGEKEQADEYRRRLTAAGGKAAASP